MLGVVHAFPFRIVGSFAAFRSSAWRLARRVPGTWAPPDENKRSRGVGLAHFRPIGARC